MDNILLILGNTLTVIGGAGAVTFTVSYGVFFNWRKTAAGRSLFYVFASMGLLFLNNSLSSLMGVDYPGRNAIRSVILTLIVFTMWRLVWVLWRNWHRGDHRPLNIEAKTRKKE